MLGKKCPKCYKKFGDLHQYCSKCGIELGVDHNRCSEKNSALCEKAFFSREDDFCSYCGAPTTYAAERDRLWKEKLDHE